MDALAPDVERNRRQVAAWLLCVCGMILVMIGLGGATRLTGSGLSIMEWAPIRGALPPMSEAEWQRLYGLYQQIPQYQLKNAGFGIDGFKHIFWLEWAHRLWGRLIGLVFLFPLIWLWAKGRVERRLVPRLVVLFVLGGLQGAVGWIMVRSGFFPESTAVSPYRLVVHLSLALMLYAAVLWTALSLLWPRVSDPSGHAKVTLARRLAGATVGFVAITILAGGFVAGIHAGIGYNTFPLMYGELVPSGYARLSPFWRNLTENNAAVQFDHRLVATLTLLIATAAVITGMRAGLGRRARAAVIALGVAVAGQYVLGVLTLLQAVPVALGTAHQVMATLVLTAALAAFHMMPVRRE